MVAFSQQFLKLTMVFMITINILGSIASTAPKNDAKIRIEQSIIFYDECANTLCG